ncbi:MAG: FAD/NAD(P)-binding protein [Aliidongia sp.]
MSYEMPHTETRRRTIVVIGAGYGGLQFFLESLDLAIRQELNDSLRYIFVDSRPVSEYGRGVAWATEQSDRMLTNNHCPEIVTDLETRETVGSIRGVCYSREPTAGELFVKRTDVGAIFVDKFHTAITRAKQHGIELHTLVDEVIDVEKVGVNYDVILKSEQRLQADYIVMALGHIAPTTYCKLLDCENYIGNPWVQITDERVMPVDAEIAVIGLGPTAVDTIIKLRDCGIKNVKAYSRSGTMQYPRPIPSKYSLKIATEDNIMKLAREMGHLRIDTLIGLVTAEFLIQEVDWMPFLDAVKASRMPPLEALRHGYAVSNKGADWFGLISALIDCIPISWHLLEDSERGKMLKILNELSNVLYGMAPSNALRILQELEDKTLKVFDNLIEIEHDKNSNQFSLIRKTVDGNISDAADYVINCTGFGTDITQAESPLVKNLVAREILKPHEFGGAIVDFLTGQITRSDSDKVHQIYCLSGTLNIGTRLITNGLVDVAGSARRTAQAIHQRFCETL